MKTLLCYFLCIASLTAVAQNDEKVLESALYNLPNISFKKIINPGDPYLRYELLIKQPLDHAHVERGFFTQRVVLTHRGFNNPTVMETQGYELPATSNNDLDKILMANDLNIEYRFCGKSVPDSMQWEYLTEEQATADYHAINQLFKNIYKGKWISTGISKGGSTTIYYKYFFPDDVDLSIPYVAPLDNSLEDKRIYTFLDTMGSPECRNKIKALQLFLLNHESEAIEKLNWYSKGAGLHYTYTGSVGKSFEYAVLEFPFAFWQYYPTNGCDSIPTNNVLDDYLSAVIKTADLYGFADEGIKSVEAHYYQAATQCGYYSYNIAPFKKQLHYFTENPSAAFPPKSAGITHFEASLNQKVQNWLAEHGNNIIYIYGGYDTWSAAGITVSDKVNSKKFIVPKTNHATARVKNMDSAMQQAFVAAVKQMAGINVVTAEVVKY